MKSCRIVLVIFSLSLLLSCGKKSSGGGRAGRIQEQTPGPEGMYSATALPVNSSVARNVKGLVTVTKYGDDINIRVSLKNAPAGTHIQGLYTGESCPSVDTNGDGYIDIREASSSIGKMLVPFDGDISGQREGNDFYPDGSYTYERSASYSLMLSDLRRREVALANMAKLKERELRLEGKVIVILGVNQGHSLPATVASYDNYAPHRTIPIACGILSYIPEGSEPIPQEIPDRDPVRVRPRVDPDPGPIYQPPKPEPEPNRGGLLGRVRDRIERWWNRLGRWWRGGGSSDDQDDDYGSEDKP